MAQLSWRIFALGTALGTAAAVCFAQPPKKTSAPDIFLDPGHGGAERGTRAQGLEEAVLTLELARLVQEALRAHSITAALSRNDDGVTLLPSQRAQLANASGARALLALHFNHSPTPSAHGLRFFVPKPIAASKEAPLSWNIGAAAFQAESHHLALELSKACAPHAAKPPLQQLGMAAFRGLGLPAVVVELGYLSHSETLAKVKNTSYRRSLAMRLAQGIAAWLAKNKAPAAP